MPLVFIVQITGFIQHIAGSSTKIKPILEKIVNECDVGSDGILSGMELKYCARIIQPGFIFSILLKNNGLVPHVYGSCGEVVASEYASSEMLHTGIFDRKPWTQRVEVSIALLDVIQKLEHTPYGTLYLCDMQWKNFGIVRDDDGKIIVKSIDNDKSFFNVTWLANQSETCSVDHDCRVARCSFLCNQTSHTCTQQLRTNNLEVWLYILVNKAKCKDCIKKGMDMPYCCIMAFPCPSLFFIFIQSL